MTGRKDFLVDWALVTIFYFASWPRVGGWDGLGSTWYSTVYSNE